MKQFKLLFLSLISVILLASCNNDSIQSYTINGEIIGTTEGDVFLKTRGETGYETLDSAKILNGKFILNGRVEQTQFAYITSPLFRGGVPVFVENVDINIKMHKDSVGKASITGSKSQEIYSFAKNEMDSFDAIWQDFYYNIFRYMTDEEKAKNENKVNILYDSAQLEKKSFLLDYLKKNNDNAGSAQLLLDNESALGDDMITSFESLSPKALATSSGEELNKRIVIVRKTAIGQPLIDFSMNDTTGNAVQLSEFIKGKYVLVDFWAAWCSPCRKENPNVVANYEKYHDKGFDVLGVSFDQKKANWLKAIKDDGLMWAQVSDLKGWQNAAGKLYGIRSIPQNILISPDGIIMAKNLRGEALGKKLSELFD